MNEVRSFMISAGTSSSLTSILVSATPRDLLGIAKAETALTPVAVVVSVELVTAGVLKPIKII